MDQPMATSDTKESVSEALRHPGMNGDEFRKAAHAAIEEGRPDPAAK